MRGYAMKSQKEYNPLLKSASDRYGAMLGQSWIKVLAGWFDA